MNCQEVSASGIYQVLFRFDSIGIVSKNGTENKCPNITNGLIKNGLFLGFLINEAKRSRGFFKEYE